MDVLLMPSSGHCEIGFTVKSEIVVYHVLALSEQSLCIAFCVDTALSRLYNHVRCNEHH